MSVPGIGSVGELVTLNVGGDESAAAAGVPKTAMSAHASAPTRKRAVFN
jgi:hypothetical protein